MSEFWYVLTGGEIAHVRLLPAESEEAARAKVQADMDSFGGKGRRWVVAVKSMDEVMAVLRLAGRAPGEVHGELEKLLLEGHL